MGFYLGAAAVTPSSDYKANYVPHFGSTNKTSWSWTVFSRNHHRGDFHRPRGYFCVFSFFWRHPAGCSHFRSRLGNKWLLGPVASSLSELSVVQLFSATFCRVIYSARVFNKVNRRNRSVSFHSFGPNQLITEDGEAFQGPILWQNSEKRQPERPTFHWSPFPTI